MTIIGPGLLEPGPGILGGDDGGFGLPNNDGTISVSNYNLSAVGSKSGLKDATVAIKFNIDGELEYVDDNDNYFPWNGTSVPNQWYVGWPQGSLGGDFEIEWATYEKTGNAQVLIFSPGSALLTPPPPPDETRIWGDSTMLFRILYQNGPAEFESVCWFKMRDFAGDPAFDIQFSISVALAVTA